MQIWKMRDDFQIQKTDDRAHEAGAWLLKVQEAYCNLCLQSFPINDPLLEQREERHEDHHDPTKPHGSRNQTWGEVNWTVK